ncbi:MAG TPA: alkaline phosphatase family protein [candidate division Zixibacteria bacterium]|nr:alkaline phosphatase family protein [candidate division Zixibacteria bacterium]
MIRVLAALRVCPPGVSLSIALLLILPACSTGSSANNTNIPKGMSAQHVVLVVLENTNYADVTGNGTVAPYLNSLAVKGSLIKNYYANVHPSIGNYFELTTGAMASTDDAFTGTVAPPTIVDALSSANKSWRYYGESLPAAAYLGGDQFPYLRHHNPFSYFSSVQGSAAQAANIVPYTQFATDLASGNLPAFAMVVPNAIDDVHSCPDQTTTSCTFAQRLGTADTWMRNNIDPLLSNPQFQQSGVLAVTFDESRDDNINGGGQVFTVLVGAGVKQNYVGTGTYQHQSMLRTVLQLLGANSFPGDAANAPAMTEIFQ